MLPSLLFSLFIGLSTALFYYSLLPIKISLFCVMISIYDYDPPHYDRVLPIYRKFAYFVSLSIATFDHCQRTDSTSSSSPPQPHLPFSPAFSIEMLHNIYSLYILYTNLIILNVFHNKYACQCTHIVSLVR